MRRECKWFAAAVCAVAVCAAAGNARASLADKLGRLTNTPEVVSGVPGLGVGPFDIPSTGNVATEIVQRLAVRGIDFPVTSTTPGVAFRLNPRLGVFEQVESLGPVFAERAESLGKGKFELGLSILYADLNEFNGGDLELATPSGLFALSDADTGDVLYNLDRVQRIDFSLEQFLVNFSATYGITDRWDVNLLMPIVHSYLSAVSNDTVFLTDPTGAGGAVDLAPIGVTDDAFGPGDLQVRTKYRLLDDPVQLAGVLSTRFPTGDPADFQGIGDFTVTPLFVASKTFGSHEIHFNGGFEINADDLERSRARYALGGSLQIIEELALLVDFIGSSGLAEDDFTTSALVGAATGVTVNSVSVVRATPPVVGTIDASIDRTDIIDMATGFKFRIADRVIGFLGAIVPLNDDGLRADYIPTGAVEVPF